MLSATGRPTLPIRSFRLPPMLCTTSLGGYKCFFLAKYFKPQHYLDSHKQQVKPFQEEWICHSKFISTQNVNIILVTLGQSILLKKSHIPFQKVNAISCRNRKGLFKKKINCLLIDYTCQILF